MKLLLQRHAKAEKRRNWDGPDRLRPLTATGLQQAETLAERFGAAPLERIVTSPHLRCLQTVAPLAAARGLRAERCEQLAKGERPEKALEQLLEGGRGTVLCCGHAEELTELRALAVERGVQANYLEHDPPEQAPVPDERLAVLDLGSTSFHLLVADVTRAGRLTPVERESLMLRLGAVIGSGPTIPATVCASVLRAADQLAATARRAGAQRILPVGTAALREASNGPELALRIGERLGAQVRILDGETEARLIFSAFRRRVLLPSKPALGVDLGGGSLELAVGDEGGLLLEETLPLGAVRLHEELAPRDPMRKREARAIVDRTNEQLQPILEALERTAPVLSVAAGGTARALGHLATGLRGLRPTTSVNELHLPLDELRALTEVLVHADHEQRLQLPGIQRRRADLLPTGALILTTLAEATGLGGFTLCDWGLREGVLLEAAAAS